MALTINQEFLKLRKLKRTSLAAGKVKSKAEELFKKQQAHVLTRCEAQGIESMKTYGTLFAVVEKVKGGVEDRAEYVKYALDNDEGLQEFIAEYEMALGCHYEPDHTCRRDLKENLYRAITGLAVLSLREDGALLNRLARSHVDDGIPMPPGTNCRPDPYISQTTK